MKGFAAGMVAGAVLTGAVGAYAASKTYQFTGAVTAVDAKELSVDKGGDIWSFALDSDTKGGAGIKAGDKVTVTYRMFATKIEKK
jgi:hypothetical protein